MVRNPPLAPTLRPGATGDALVELPGYFEALNRDYRYQLTVIGQFAQAMVSKTIQGNQFRIKTDKPNVEVSWQVTGIRQDPAANLFRVEVEHRKPDAERGKFLVPEAYGLSKEHAINHHAQTEPPAPPEEVVGRSPAEPARAMP